MIRSILFAVFALLCTASFGQSGYSLDFEITGWKDTTAYLGHYFGESTVIRDTAHVNSKGQFSFSKKNTLGPGVYFIVLGKTRMFDFAVGTDQEFKLSSTADDLLGKMTTSGDEENKIFFENIAFNVARHKEADPYIILLRDSTVKDEEKIKHAREEFNKINDKVMAYQREVIASHPTAITAKAFKATMAVEVPEAPKKADGTIDSSFRYRYYRQHFFDNFDLADEALLRLPQPLYREKIKEYLERMIVPQPDSITKAIEQIVAIAKKNQETYKFIVFTCISLYQNPEIMGLDEVFVNMDRIYFESGEMDFWASKPIKKNIKDYADKVARAMIGRKAPNLIMQDENLKARSMYDIKKKYTVLFFYDPDCGHCRQESPKLVDFYNKNRVKYDLEVFAITTDSSMKKMRDYIKEMKMPWITVNGPRSFLKEHYSMLYFAELTPTLYILDADKKIIARKLPVEKIDEFLTNYERFHPKKASTPSKGT